MNKIENVTAKNLRAGMVLGSGFVVTHNAWVGVRTPKRKVNVEGFYPGQPNAMHQWNVATVVQVVSNI